MSSPAYTPAQLLADLLTAKSQSANAAAESIAALGLGSYSSAQSAMVRIGQGVVPRSNTLGPLEAYFGVDRSAFTSNAAAHSAAVKLGLRGSNVAPAPAYKNDKKYPLISPVQAGMWTITARCGDPGAYQQVKVRLAGIDAPERRQDYGNRSRQALASLCHQKDAKITPRTTDRYGRMVADVECQQQDAGAWMVRGGWAMVFDRYASQHRHLYPLQREARAERVGQWALLNEGREPVPPWEWRRMQREGR